VIVFLLFGYQKWFAYEAQVLIPFISNGPLISWMYPFFGTSGATWFLGVMEWLFGLLLFWGFWNRKAGILGALGSCATYVGTVTIIPFMPNGWDVVAGGFPAMTGNVPFLMKDVVLLAVSFYLLKQDVIRWELSAERGGTANYLIEKLANVMSVLGLLSEDLEYHLLRASMVIIFAFFGYTKWHQYAAQLMYPALGATATFATTVTIIPFMPNGWDPVAGFPAMAGNVPFLMKDIVLLAVSIYLLKQDVVRILLSNRNTETVPKAISSTAVVGASRHVDAHG
jgi:uncharacterized membrane protein YkgB